MREIKISIKCILLEREREREGMQEQGERNLANKETDGVSYGFNYHLTRCITYTYIIHYTLYQIYSQGE